MGVIAGVLGPGWAAGQRSGAGAGIRFEDAAGEYGVAFTHHTGARGDKQLPETMGAGVAWLDYDRDGRQDLYFVDSGPLPSGEEAGSTTDPPPAGADQVPANALFRHRPSGGFVRVARSGAEDPSYGMGATVADFDNDGWPDIYVSNLRANRLFRNNGDGTFEDVTDSAGVGGSRWSVGSAWADLDLDGLVDLFVVNYVGYDLRNPRACGRLEQGIRSYCHISLFDGEADILYRNLGDGTLRDVGEAAGIANPTEGKGLGVVIADVNDDGMPDVYVANDTARNFLYMNRGDLRFEDVGLTAGVGFSEDGKAQAGMGTDMADVDGDQRLDIVVTNFAFEPVNLYRAVVPGVYFDDSYPLGLGEPTLPLLGFGASFGDLDADGDRDLLVANGHILDDVDKLQDNASYPQPNQVFENRLTDLRDAALEAGEPAGWRPRRRLFVDASAGAGAPFVRARVSRGLAIGDADADGLPDAAITNSGGEAELLRNITAAAGNRFVLRLRGRGVNRDAAGAVAQIVTPPDGHAQILTVRAGSSYASQGATDLYVGLGTETRADVEILWPGGDREVVKGLEPGFLHVITEAHGVTASRSLVMGNR